jgi:ABC-2 type transport system ATP-binding protein
MERDTVLVVEGLSKNYNGVTVVDNISFQVQSQGVFGLLGPNGAGKTTTIRMLCGLLKSDSGEVKIDGISMSDNYNEIKKFIGLCPQEIVIWENLTCFEQLKFMGVSYGLNPNHASKRAEYLLNILGLIDKRHKLAGTLSGGMQRRLNILLALVHDPKLIILDEPQAGLDPQSRILVRDFIRLLAKDKAVILTTHDMDEADRLSDCVAIIDHGKILLIDTPEKIKENSGMKDVIQVIINDADAHKVEQLIKALPPSFTDKKYMDGILLLEGNDVTLLIPSISKALKDYRISMDSMTIRKKTLEDAFISMTGRGLRE